MTISVTAEDISEGCPGSPWACPVARAITRATLKVATVRRDFIKLSTKSRIASFLTPLPVCVFINGFDRDKPVQPFDFDLPIDLEKL